MRPPNKGMKQTKPSILELRSLSPVLDGHDVNRVVMTAVLKRLRLRPTSRAEAFASAHFGSCPDHQREAIAVHRVLEDRCDGRIDCLDPDVTIAEFFSSRIGAALRASILARIDQHQSLAPGARARSRERVKLMRPLLAEARRKAAARLMAALLGPTARQSTWDPQTIWSRSIRGVVNERVRYAGHDSCVEARSRPTRS
jgi:hypothetical protein